MKLILDRSVIYIKYFHSVKVVRALPVHGLVISSRSVTHNAPGGLPASDNSCYYGQNGQNDDTWIQPVALEPYEVVIS